MRPRLALSLPEPATVNGEEAISWLSVGPCLVLLAGLFNLVLCFIDTRHWMGGSSTQVIACELAIMATGLFAIRRYVSHIELTLAGLVMLIVIGLKLINPSIDLKILHDVGIAYIFYKLGNLTPAQDANRLVWIFTVLVMLFGAFELLAPTIYAQVFDIWSYYVDKGALSQSTVDYSQSNFFISGSRAGEESRTLLPGLLGPHRVSSLFLEPVSMGNFAVIIFAWCLIAPVRQRVAIGICAALCVILADSRFGIGCCVLMAAARLAPWAASRLIVFLLPVFAVLALVTAGSVLQLPGITPAILQDNLSGRLLFSGRMLNDWGWRDWLALSPSPVYTADTGYAYAINNLGIPLALFLQAVFSWHEVHGPRASLMRLMLALYLASSLCIGASIFSIKTAALAWFLYGSLDRTESRRNFIQKVRFSTS